MTKTISYAEHLVVSGPSFDAFLAREVDEHMGDVPQRGEPPERADWRDDVKPIKPARGFRDPLDFYDVSNVGMGWR